MRFDVLVIGGGTAGCVVAARLSEDPARTVCLVEAGPDYDEWSPWSFDELEPYLLRAERTIRAEALAERVVVARGKALGAVIDGSETLAERVVVCAGSYATPAILLRNGIGPADELRRHGIVPVLDELPVGEGLVDHPCAASSTPSRRARSGASSTRRERCSAAPASRSPMRPSSQPFPGPKTNLSTVAVAELLAERIAAS